MPRYPTLLVYKLQKLSYDYARAHTAMLRMCPNRDHASFRGTNSGLRIMRYVADDLAADAVAAWDALLDEVFASLRIPSGGVQTRLTHLRTTDPAVGSLVDDAWNRLLTYLNDVRNEYQHAGFWRNSFGVGQGNGPFQMDLIAPVGTEKVFILRDARRAAHLIRHVHTTAGLRMTIRGFKNPCERCYGDKLIDSGFDWTAPYV